ncbi:protein phosphatase 1 regulatory subunit 15A-like isoform X2 [Lagopus leucura]|uniref:protein phosphatase 1 regulatory subunit 15A-like isoform X2 n=1 Tax=Lagopus leucura TaxID=30410 RepID=UPI001C66C167|nr:protein phosphatase 1 regulatory subunit 15A-like isoform X2 [Lagopus leucura]
MRSEQCEPQNMSPPCAPPMAAEDPLQPPILHALFYRPEPDEDDDDEQGWDGDTPETPPADGDPPKTVEPLNTEEPASNEDHPRNTKRVRFSLQVQVFLLQPPPDPDARRGPWETLARDRLRFAHRCALLSPVLQPILQPSHRERVWERLQKGESLWGPPGPPC